MMNAAPTSEIPRNVGANISVSTEAMIRPITAGKVMPITTATMKKNVLSRGMLLSDVLRGFGGFGVFSFSVFHYRLLVVKFLGRLLLLYKVLRFAQPRYYTKRTHTDILFRKLLVYNVNASLAIKM